MILVEIENNILNLSNANVIDFSNNLIIIYFNHQSIITIEDTKEILTDSFGDYFFNYSDLNSNIFFNKYNFLYLESLENNTLRFNFFDNYHYELQNVNIKFFLEQVT